MKLPRIIGVAGTNGSGKDTLGELLSEEAGYTDVSLSDILRGILDEQGLPHTRENLSATSKAIREAEGDGAMVRRVVAEHGYDTGLCITSIRTGGEVDELHRAGGILVWIDADEKVRYDRIVSAKRGRNEDTVTFEEFQRQQRAEMTPSVQGGGLNMGAVLEKADVLLENEFKSLDAYKQYLRDYFEISSLSSE